MILEKVKTIAITGSQGYIGQRLSKALQQRNISSTTIERIKTTDDSFIWSTLPLEAHVIHLAGRTDVLESWDDPVGYYEANATSTIKLLEKCREQNCTFTLLSSYPYGQPAYLPIDEEHSLNAVNPYGLSKVAADEIVRFYANNYDLNANVLRLFNCYGPGQQHHLLIPTIAKQLIDTESTEIKVKDLSPKRDYIYISDVLNAIIAVAGKGKGEAFNLGSGRSYSVQEIVDGLIVASGRTDVIVKSENSERRNEIPDVVANTKKLKSLIDWTPEISLSDGLREVYKLELDSVRKKLK